MSDHMTPVPQETCGILSTLITALGACIGILGVLNVLEGCGGNAPSAQEMGEQQLKAGGSLVFLAAYIRRGTLPEPEIMEYLAAR